MSVFWEWGRGALSLFSLFSLLPSPRLPARRRGLDTGAEEVLHRGRSGPAPLGLAHVPGHPEMAPGSGLLGSGILIGPRQGLGAGPGQRQASLAAESGGPLWPRWLRREEPPWSRGRGRRAVLGWVRGAQLRSPGWVGVAGGWPPGPGAERGGQGYRGPGLSPALAGGGRGNRAWRRAGPRSSSRRPASSCAPCSRRPGPAAPKPRHAAPGALRGRAARRGRPPGAGGSPG